ncbi:MAG: type II toxin-antitoxin system mRNA interferase toxin, RelE/StbE family [Leptolyngbyaceae cyanobacterium RM1_406_9]|nr:type II toxin-antitoxin system mRNA interferase toxin, RelE/StbE family [Leptolyngbyaceae cyanobacterium RM1_406_9]
MEVSFSSTFKRTFKKRIKGNADLEARFWQKLEQFTAEPFDPSLRTHKLSGKLKEFWSFSVDYSERVLFYFTEDGKAVFVDIGSQRRGLLSDRFVAMC